MYGDISRDSHDWTRNFTRVLMQQGRPLTDADWNEQVAILADREWHLIRALLGKCHGTFNGGFYPALRTVKADQAITLCSGSYYVNGLRCDLENPPECRPFAGDHTTEYFLALRAYEQSVNPAMDSDILEPALRGIDTAWRSRVIWDVIAVPKTVPPDKPVSAKLKKGAIPVEAPKPSLIESCPIDFDIDRCLRKKVERFINVRRLPLATGPTQTPCDLSGFGATGTLGEAVYRIEVHHGGKVFQVRSGPDSNNCLPCAADGVSPPAPAPAGEGTANNSELLKDKMKFKWSRENGAAVYAIAKVDSNPIKLDASRFVSKSPLQTGDWLELFDQEGLPRNRDRNLVTVNVQAGQYTLSDSFQPVDSAPGDFVKEVANSPSKLPLTQAKYHVRRWNQYGDRPARIDQATITANANRGIATLDRDGCVVAVARGDLWITLEGGLQIQFDLETCYEPGDYWIIRASDFTHNGLVPNFPNESPPPVVKYPRAGGWNYAVLGMLTHGSATWDLTAASHWNGKRLEDDSGRAGCDNCQATPTDAPLPVELAPEDTPPVVAPKEATPAPAPRAESGADDSASFLSPDGRQALAPLLASRGLIARRVPARYLNLEPTSAAYRRFRGALLVSEILEPAVEPFLDKVRRCLPGAEAEWAEIEHDARADYALAIAFERMLLAGDGARSVIA